MTAVRPLDAAGWEREVLASPLPVLVDFWAPWCGPCELIEPIVEEIAARHAGALLVGSLDIDEHPAVAARYDVLSIPTLLLFVGGAPVERIIGAHRPARIESTILPHLRQGS